MLLVACAGSSTTEDRAGAPACGEQVGRTVEHGVDALDTRAGSLLVHLPPCYDSESSSYPTLWLMHGGGATADMWVDHPLEIGSIADSLALDASSEKIFVPV